MSQDPLINPVVVSRSIIASRYTNGIVIGTDTLSCRGRLKAYRSLKRIIHLSKNVVLVFSGELSDFQYIEQTLKSNLASARIDNGSSFEYSPKEVLSFIRHQVSMLRRQQKPVYTEILVCGLQRYNDGSTSSSYPFMAICDHLGNVYTDEIICTGIMRQMAAPVLEKSAKNKDDLIETTIKVLKINFLRSTASLDRVDLCIIEVDRDDCRVENREVIVSEGNIFEEHVKAKLV